MEVILLIFFPQNIFIQLINLTILTHNQFNLILSSVLHHAVVYLLLPLAHRRCKPSHHLIFHSGNSSLRCPCPPPHLPPTSPAITAFPSTAHSSPQPLVTFFSPQNLYKTLLHHCRASLSSSFSDDKVGETYLDLKSAPLDIASAIIHRAIITDQQNKRQGTASMLTRGKVRGRGAKLFPQKKTCKGWCGLQRTPLQPDEGVVFGPMPKDWSIKINRKEKKLALSTMLASAAAGSTIVVEDFGDKFEKPGTKAFIEVMKRWGLDSKQKSMFLMMEVPDNVRLSSRNIWTSKMLMPGTLNGERSYRKGGGGGGD